MVNMLVRNETIRFESYYRHNMSHLYPHNDTIKQRGGAVLAKRIQINIGMLLVSEASLFQYIIAKQQAHSDIL